MLAGTPNLFSGGRMKLLKSLAAFLAIAAFAAADGVSVSWAADPASTRSRSRICPTSAVPRRPPCPSRRSSRSAGVGAADARAGARARGPRGHRLHPAARPQPLEPRRGGTASVQLRRGARSGHQRLRDAGRLHHDQQRLVSRDHERERARRACSRTRPRTSRSVTSCAA